MKDALYIDQIEGQWIVHGNVDGVEVKMEASSFEDACEKATLYLFEGEEQ